MSRSHSRKLCPVDHTTTLACLAAALNERERIHLTISALEREHKSNHVIIRISWDLEPAAWGASVQCCTNGGVISRLDFFGSPSASRLLDNILAFFAGDSCQVWLKGASCDLKT